MKPISALFPTLLFPILLVLTSLFLPKAVSAPPSGWVLYPEQTVALDGSRVTFQCKPSASGFNVRVRATFTAGTPIPTSIRNDGTFSILFGDSTATVTIRNFNKTIEGLYFCIGVHADPSKDLEGPKVAFKVAVAPKRIGPQADIVFGENEAANVSCAFDGVPTPNITIYRAATRLVASTGDRTSITYDIDRVQRSDADNYRCVAENIAGREEFTRKLVVEYKPSITTPIVTKRVSNGSRVSFACDTNALPAPSYSWLHNGSKIESGVVSANGTLSVIVTSLNDTGKYTCVATNSRGKDQRDFELVVKVPPGPPGKPVAIAVGINDVTLNWVPGFDGYGTVSEYKVQHLIADGSNKWEQYNGGKGVQGPPTKLTGLDPNKRYYFKVKAVNEVGKGDFGPSSDEIITHPLVPPKAENVDIDNIEPTQFTVYWQAPFGLGVGHGTIRRYIVRYFVTAEGVAAAKSRNTSDGSIKTMKLTGLSKGTEYTVAVAAANRIFTGSFSTSVTTTTDTTVPDAVTGLDAQPVTDKVVQLSWKFPADLGGLPITKIIIEYKESSSAEWIEVTDQPKPTDTNAAVTGLTEKKSYVFQVTIENSKGPSRPAVSSSVTTPANEAPSQPTLSVNSRQVSFIILNWSDNGPHKADLWRLDKRELPSSSWDIARDKIEGSRTDFTVENLSSNTTYLFRLRGQNRAGDGPWSAEVEATTLPRRKPETVNSIQVEPSLEDATVTWGELKPSEDDLQLKLYWMKVGDSEPKYVMLETGVTEHALTGLQSNTTYIVWLVTEANGLESVSMQYNFTTKSEDNVGEVGNDETVLTTGIIIAIAASGGVLLFLLILCICCCCSSRRKAKYSMNSEDRPSSWIEGPVDSSGWYRTENHADTVDDQYSSFGTTERDGRANGRTKELQDPMHSMTLSYAELQFVSPHHRPPRIQQSRREETPYAEIDHNEMQRRSRSRSAEPVEVPITTLEFDFGIPEQAQTQHHASPPPFEPVASPTFESDV